MGEEKKPKDEAKKEKKPVTIQPVNNGFLVFIQGVPTEQIKISATLDSALQLAKNLLK
ncbi:MAG TPA: hypothetical protein PKZ42_01640 [Syntrophales bacterium]|nr:hypothetical protein [Syntrophales bacterium]